MAATYPGAVKTFTTKAAGGAILAAHINDLQDEVVAVETRLGVNAGTLIAYTPVITGSTTNPTIGDGTLTGHYTRVGDLVNAWIYWLFGSTTDKGSGTYYFTIPVNCSSTIVNYPMGEWLEYTSGAHHSGVIRYNSGNNKVACAVDGAVYLSSAVPVAPVAGTFYRLHIQYMA